MPNYNYECTGCETVWEELQTIANKDKPLKKPCPNCKKKGKVIKSWKDCTPGLGVDTTLTPDKATGGRWSELMTRIKKGVPERMRGKFDRHNNAKGTRWH